VEEEEEEEKEEEHLLCAPAVSDTARQTLARGTL
jgi:hypothetical protein